MMVVGYRDAKFKSPVSVVDLLYMPLESSGPVVI